MKWRRLPLLALLLLSLSGWTRGVVQNPGYAQINLGGPDLNAATTINMFKGAQALALGVNANGFSPTNMDIYGFITNKTGWTTGTLASAFPGLTTTGPLVLIWSTQRTFSITMPAAATCTQYFNAGSANCSGWSANSVFTVQTLGPSGGSISACGSQALPAGWGGCVIFTLTNNPNGGNFLFNFPQSGTYAPLPGGQVAGPNDMALVRQSDLAAMLAGQYWTPEFLTTLKALNPKYIRTMGFSHFGNDFTNQSTWAYRATIASWSWGQNSVWPPGAWGGTISSAGSTTYPTAVDQYSGAGAPDTPGSYTDGEVYQGTVTNAATSIVITGAAKCAANTDVCLTVTSTATLAPTGTQPVWVYGVHGTLEANSSLLGGLQPTLITVVDGTHVDLQNVPFVNTFTSTGGNGQLGTQTINIANRGAVFISNAYAGPLFINGSTDGFGTGAYVTLVYDAKLNVMKWGNEGYSSYSYSGTTPGVTGQVPLEAQVQLANAISANLWVNVPMWATDNYATNMGATVCGALNANLKIPLELSNEVWNSVYPQTNYANNAGTTFGFPTGSFGAEFAYKGMRFKQVVADFVSGGCSPSRFIPSLMFQLTGNLSETQNFLLNGLNLGGVPVATITGVSTGATTTLTFTATYPTGITTYTPGQAMVLSAITGSGCSLTNGEIVYVGPSPTASTFVLSSSQSGASSPIASSGTCTGGTAMPYYNTLSLPNWSAYPNRPVDVAVAVGYAEYIDGANFGSSYGVNNGPAMAAMQSAWVAGNTATALALFDQDMRYGTVYNSSANTLTFTCPASSTTITVSNTLSSNPTYNGQTLIIFTTTGQTCGGLALNTVYCATSISGSGFSVAPVIAPGSGTQAGTCGSPITVTNVGASGTQTVGVNVQSTMAWANAFADAQWEWLAAQYDSDGRATPLTMEQYEGGMAINAPTIAQCTTMGVSATNGATPVTFQTTSPGVQWANSGLQNGDRVSFTVSGGSLPANIGSGTNYYVANASASGFDPAPIATAFGSAGSGYYPITAFEPSGAGSGTVTATYCQAFDNLLNAYRNSSTYGKNFTLHEFQGFMGTDATAQNYGLMAHSVTPSWLGLTGYSEWSMLPGNVVQVQNGSLPPFQTYNGFQAFRSAYP